MTREEQLKFCKICRHQKFNINQGIICRLTDLAADFETSCDFFDVDWELKTQHDLKLKELEILEKTASKGKRFANYLLDFIFYLFLSFQFGVFLGLLLAIFSPESFLIFENNKLLDYLLGFFLGMLYYTAMEALTGQTLAKLITKTKVVTENGEKPDFSAILIRSLCRFIPFEPLSFLGSKKSGWHDRISKTIVIDLA